MKLSSFRENTDKQDSGSPCLIGDAYFDVRRANTPEYQMQIEDIRNKLYGFAPKNVDANEVIAHWLAEHGVTDWGGVLDEGDLPLEFNKQNCRSVFLNPEYHLSLNALLIQHAGNYQNYLYDEVNKDVEEIKKN